MYKNKEITLILHNIRSAYNVGAIVRTADAIGGSQVVTTGYTPSLRDRFGRVRTDVAKTSLGAEDAVPVLHKDRVADVLSILRAEGVYIVALEQGQRAVPYREISIRYPFALVVGNEVRGLSPAVLEKCDAVSEIPMHGQKESLNVAVAVGIALSVMCKLP